MRARAPWLSLALLVTLSVVVGRENEVEVDAGHEPADEDNWLDITIARGSSPWLVAYRADTARAWSVALRIGDRFRIAMPAGPFTVVRVCAADIAYVTIWNLVPDDVHVLDGACRDRDDRDSRTTTHVRFHNDTVSARVGDRDVSADDPDVELAPGRWDWIVQESERVAIVRDVPSGEPPALDMRDARALERVAIASATHDTTSWSYFRTRAGTESGRQFAIGTAPLAPSTTPAGRSTTSPNAGSKRTTRTCSPR